MAADDSPPSHSHICDGDIGNSVREVASSHRSLDGNALSIRRVDPAELAAARVWIENWQRMLPYVVANQGLIRPTLSEAIVRFVAVPQRLLAIEREFSTGDPVLVRAALFGLLYGGRVRAPELHTQPLSLLTSFVEAEAGSNHWKLELQAIDLSAWPTVAHTELDETARRAFEKRRHAVVRYAAGESVKSIELSTGVNRRQLYRLLERAMSPHPDGRPFGFRALVRYTRIAEYTRVQAVKIGRDRGGCGAAGALSLLFERLCRDKASGASQFRYEKDCLDNDRIELLRRIRAMPSSRICPLRIICMTSMPVRMMRAQRKSLKPIIGLMMRLMPR